MAQLVAPFNEYEARLREGFAQHRDHPSLQDPNVNAVPIFKQGQDVPRISKRDIDDQTHHQDHLIPLTAKDRKPAGAPATVETIQDFKKNFNLFSESSLVDLDWSNVVAAGSSVVTPLLPVPDKYNTSKKAQRHVVSSFSLQPSLTLMSENTTIKSLLHLAMSISSSGAWTKLRRSRRSSKSRPASAMRSLKKLQCACLFISFW